jgi:excisionase family DNA binding protein
VKRARPLLARKDLERPDALLTTGDVAGLLRVHPKHVYRLLRRGLPGHRIGGEWRFLADEVLRWSGAPVASPSVEARAPAGIKPVDRAPHPPAPPPLMAANGDIAIECLLAHLSSGGRPLIGHVQADRGLALELLRRGEVLVAGCHGSEIPRTLDDERLAFVRLVDRQVGLALRHGVHWKSLRQIGQWRLASRPQTAGVRSHLDGELRRHGVDPDAIHARAAVLPSHREVVCAVARGEADVGLTSEAWASRVGLECIPLVRETYGLLIRASQLGDRRVTRLCEVAQSAAFRKDLGGVSGYQARFAGTISFDAIPEPGRS